MYKRNMTDYLAFLCEAFSGRTVLRKIWSGLFFVGLFMLTGCGDFAGNGQGEAAVNASGDNNGVIIEDLTVEYRRNPLGLDEESPVFSWKMKSDERGQLQKAYRIRMAESPEMLADGECVWDTGKVNSDISVAIPYEGNALKAATR